MSRGSCGARTRACRVPTHGDTFFACASHAATAKRAHTSVNAARMSACATAKSESGHAGVQEQQGRYAR
jgi:hypothetical protein